MIYYFIYYLQKVIFMFLAFIFLYKCVSPSYWFNSLSSWIWFKHILAFSLFCVQGLPGSGKSQVSDMTMNSGISRLPCLIYIKLLHQHSSQHSSLYFLPLFLQPPRVLQCKQCSSSCRRWCRSPSISLFA